MARPRRRRLPLLDRLAADPADRARAGQRRRGWRFYDRLVDALLEAGIAADGDALPLGPAAGAGGRRAAGSAATPPRASASTPALVGRAPRRPGRRTGARSTSRTWSPCSATRMGAHAPGQALMLRRAARSAHHLLLGHGLAVQALRGGGRPADRHRQQPRPGAGRPATAEDDRAAADLYDTLLEPALRRPGAARPLPGGLGPTLMPRRRWPSDLAADLASPSTSTASTTTTRSCVAAPAERRPTCRSTSPRDRRATRRPTSAGRSSPRAERPAGGAARALRRRLPPIVDHRERLLATGPGPTRRVSTTRRGSTTSTVICAPSRHAMDAGRRRTRLLLLVAAGQLRVGRGLHPAVRPGPRRLRHPGPDAQALLRLVRRDSCAPSAGPRVTTPAVPVDRALAEPTERPGRRWVACAGAGQHRAVVGLLRPDPGAARRSRPRRSRRTTRKRCCRWSRASAPLVSTVLNPLWGAFSDRTTLADRAAGSRGSSAARPAARSRMLLLAGAALGLVAGGRLGAGPGVASTRCCAAITATVPDQVPTRQRGVVGGLLGDRPDRSASSPGRGSRPRPAASPPATSRSRWCWC